MLPFGGEIIFLLKIAKMGGIRHFRSSTVDPDSSADYASLLRPQHCVTAGSLHCSSWCSGAALILASVGFYFCCCLVFFICAKQRKKSSEEFLCFKVKPNI